jgi:phosphate/sulfate permease
LWSLDHDLGIAAWSEDHISSLPFLRRIFYDLKLMVSSSIADKLSIEIAIRNELFDIHSEMEKEINTLSLLSTETAKMKRLLFLFQRDLIPGINGEILESKDNRENLIVVPVSERKKIAGWLFLGLLNGGMLFYIFLFAISQDDHHQKAWGRSFFIWLILEIVLISTSMVIFMHIFLPSLIMKDVMKIRKRLLESINDYYEAMEAENEEEELDDDASSDEDEIRKSEQKRNKPRKLQITTNKQKKEVPEKTFNAAKYLFISYRLAMTFPELKASQIILQFTSPWPRQSYQHVIDVKKKYDDTYTALSRSASIILIFFLSNLLTVPLSIQDMILSLVMTVVSSYTILLHLQLYNIFPALVIVPTLSIIAVVYMLYQARVIRKAEERIHKLTNKKEKKEQKEKNLQNHCSEKEEAIIPVVATTVAVRAVPVIPASGTQEHQTRRQSLAHALQLTKQIQQNIQSSKSVVDDDDNEQKSEEKKVLPPSALKQLSLNDIDDDDDDSDLVSDLDEDLSFELEEVLPIVRRQEIHPAVKKETNKEASDANDDNFGDSFQDMDEDKDSSVLSSMLISSSFSSEED